MAFAIGFGSTEQQFEQDEEDAIRAFIVERANEKRTEYFTGAFIAEVNEWVKARSTDLKAQDACYRSAVDFPDRYGSYYATVLGDPSHLVVILSFIHTNRRHALSPDGWACMTNKRIFYVDYFDEVERFRPAEQVQA